MSAADEIPWGGYEVRDSMRYYGTTMLDPKCEPVILDGALTVLTRLT